MASIRLRNIAITDWLYERLVPLCRISLKVSSFCGLFLIAFMVSNQTFALFMFCSFLFTAHQDAYEKAKILHRDVSAGNILIIYTRSPNSSSKSPALVARGILNDWELSKPIYGLDLDKDILGPRQPNRTVSCFPLVEIMRSLV